MNKWLIVVLVGGLALLSGMLLQSRLGWLGPSEALIESGAAGEPEILYWVAPMDPNYRKDGPGKSPMGMDLLPVYANQATGNSDEVTISPAIENNLGVRTAVVERGPLWRRIDATGYVTFDESRISHIHLRTQGWIERLTVKAEGERVQAGELLFEFYSPEIVNAQKEFLQAKQRGDTNLLAAARQKLSALGVSSDDIEALSRRKTPSNTIRVHAPHAGVIMDLSVREGMHVMPATVVMSISDLSTVWLNAEVFESQVDWVAEGQSAEVELDYLPGETFSGSVDYVHPVLDPMARTLKVRLVFDNPEEALKPNMYAQVRIYGGPKPDVLSIPREALIRSGKFDRVVISLGDGRFTVQEVRPGIESGDWVEIMQGLEEGDRIVTSAQFLIDSEASISGSIRRLSALDQPGTSGEHQHD